MAEQVGAIEYSVRFDVAEVISSTKSFDKSMEGVETAAMRADKMIAELSKDTKQLGTQMTQTAVSVKAATSSMGNMRGIASNIGYQLQDVAVQAQAGTSALVILGQQGSQLLGSFGAPGVIAGTILAVGAALASALAPSLTEAKDSAADLEAALSDLKGVITTTADETDVLTERVAKLAETNKEAAKAEVALGITKAMDAMAASADLIIEAVPKATKTVDGWLNSTGQMSTATSQVADLEIIMKRFKVSAEEAFDGKIPAKFQQDILGLVNYVETLGSELGVTNAQALEFVQATDAFSKSKSPETAARLAASINSINETNNYTNRSFVELGATVGENVRVMQDAADKSDVLNNALNNISAAANESTEALNRNKSAIDGIIASATMEAATIGKSERERALYVATLAKATEAELAQINAQYDSIEASEKSIQTNKEAESAAKKAASESEAAQKKLESQYQSNESSLKRMAQQLSIAGLSTQGLAKEAAELAAIYSLGEGATETQINQAKQLTGALFDLNEQRRQEKELESQKAEARKFTEQVSMDAASPLAQIDIEEQAKLAKLQEYMDAQLIQEQEFQMAKSAIQKDAAAQRLEYEQATSSMMLSASSDMFGGLADLAGAFAGEQSSAYKALFAVSKGFAIANAALQLQTAIANAMAIPWPANIPAIAQAAAMGAQVAGNIAGINYGGGRQYGGPVNPGSLYRTGEGNSPELLSMGGSNYLLPGSRGSVTPMDGASGGVNFIINNTVSDQVQTQQTYDSETNTATLVIKEIARQIDSRTGDVGRSMKRAGAYGNSKL